MKEEIKHEQREDMFTDDADIVRHTTKIHSKETTLSEDHVLTRWHNEKEKNFVRQSHLISDRIVDFIQDKDVADFASNTVRRDSNNLAILNRNDPQNWLLRKIFGKTTSNDADRMDEEMDRGFIEKGKDHFFGKKKTINEDF